MQHKVNVIIDTAQGFALKAQICHKTPSVIVTDNPCPEYWEDLWEHLPTVLIARQNFNLEDLKQAVLQAEESFLAGKRSKQTPYYQSLLTLAERKVLRLCALGLIVMTSKSLVVDRAPYGMGRTTLLFMTKNF